MESRLESIEINSIDFGPRARKDWGDLLSLQKSLSETGLIHPIAVMEQEKGKFLLLAGGRRLTAASAEGWRLIDAKVFPSLDEYDRKTIELIENIEREDLTYAERAALVEEMHQLQIAKFGQAERSSTTGHSIRDTAELLGASKSSIAQELELARVIKLVPSLGKMRNKSEALSAMKLAKRQLDEAEAAETYEREVKNKGTDKQRTALVESYMVANFFDGTAKVEPGSIDLIELDPPFGIDLQNIKTHSGLSNPNMWEYKEVEVDDYPEFIHGVAEVCFRLAAPDSWLLCWFSTKFHFESTAIAIESAGFKLNRLPIVWNKPTRGRTLVPGLLLPSTYETLFYAWKGKPYLATPDHSNVLDSFQLVKDKSKVHPTEKSVELYEEILSVFCLPNSVIMSGFLGSGNILLGASNARMRAFGFDLVEEYRNRYIERVMSGIPGSYKSDLVHNLAEVEEHVDRWGKLVAKRKEE